MAAAECRFRSRRRNANSGRMVANQRALEVGLRAGCVWRVAVARTWSDLRSRSSRRREGERRRGAVVCLLFPAVRVRSARGTFPKEVKSETVFSKKHAKRDNTASGPCPHARPWPHGLGAVSAHQAMTSWLRARVNTPARVITGPSRGTTPGRDITARARDSTAGRVAMDLDRVFTPARGHTAPTVTPWILRPP